MIKAKMSLMDKVMFGLGKCFKSEQKVKSNLVATLIGPDGLIKDIRTVHNTVTTAGKYGAADQILASPSLTKPGWMEVGTGTGGTTKLNTYVADSRTALDSKTRSDAVVTMVCTFGAGVGTGALTEAGIFDVVTQDTANMWCYATFDVINKAAGDSLVVTWTLTYA
jgi:hypothetical protein